MLLAQTPYGTLSRFFIATCTLFPLGGLTLLGLSGALCLGDVKTASFEIFHNWKEIKHFLSFVYQSLSCIRRKSTLTLKLLIIKGSFEKVAGDHLF